MGILKRFFSKNGLDGFSKTVTNVADPVDPQDAATKSFSSNASNLTTGTVPGSVTPAYTGDVTKPAGSTALTLANSGATAGTYKSVTVDAKGRVTAGSNPTTLAGYGITDAAPSSHVGATGTAHGNATTSVAGFMSSTDKTKLDGIAAGANNYVHPTGDGNSHIPVTGTGSNGKVLAAGSTANSAAWVTLDLTYIPDAAFKKSVRVATTANITLSGLQTIDDITTVANDRVLVKDQTTASQNGIYLASATAWTRVPDANTASTIAGACVNVDSGTVNGGLRFDTDFKATDTLNTTAMSWNRVLDTGLASSVVGSAPGTAAVGTSLNYARADHVHPLQTTVSGNAGTATKLATARNINGVAFDGSANITINAVDSTARIASSEKGVANGVATLDANGLVPSNQLPSYVDDVLEYAAFANFPATGTASVIYVDNSTNKIYRWSGSAYIEISPVAGNADTATKLATARSISASGDASWTVSFDGSANATAALTLANSGATAGTYKSVTVDAKGRVTGGTNPTTLAGYGITDAAPSSHIGATGAAHGAATTSVNGFMSSTDKTKLDGIATGANNYVHPTGDGNSHVPATGTTNNGKVLAAGSTANSAAWVTLDLTYLPDASFKKSVRVATTANITLSGLQTVDGITVAANDRVLVKDQTTASQNGIYLANASTWTRAADANTASTIAGATVNVDSGTTNGGLRFDTDFKTTDTLGTTAMNWNRVLDTGLASSIVGAAPGTAAVGTSLNYARADHVHPAQTSVSGNAGTATALATGRTIGMTGDVTWTSATFDGSANVTGTATLANSGVTAGTYPKVTVDAKGRVTAGAALAATDVPSLDWSKITTGKPTTLAGYGITDAAASSHVGATGAAHGVATTSVNGFMSSTDKTKLDGIATGANNYTHPSTDGSLHVPATGTTNGGKVLVAGSTAGSFSWTTLDLSYLPDASFKKSVRVATTANITLSGLQTIDGITTVANDRVLVKDQTVPADNGIYLASASTWTRATDASSASMVAGAAVNVDSGTTNGGLRFDTDFKTTDTLGTTAMNWNRVLDTGLASAVVGSTPGTAAVGTSISYARADHVHPAQTTITGNAGTATTLQTGRTIGMTGDVTWTSASFNGSANVTGTATLANSGVTAGTYKSVTVDAKGRVTAGTNPTTLAGYGITDAAPSSHVGSSGTAHAEVTTTVAGFMSAADKTKLDGVATGANNYVHPTGDGNLHVPATSTTNNGKFLQAGATAGSLAWAAVDKTTVGLANVDNTSDANKPISTATQTALNGKEATITAGTAAQYWKGTKTWSDLATDVRAVVLTGLSTATNAAIAATDSILVAFGKLQAQLTALSTTVSSKLGSSDIGVTVQGYDANTAKTNVSNIWTAPQRASMGTDTTGAFDLSVYQNYTSTPTAAVTLTFSNHASGVAGAIIFNNTADYAVSAAATTKITAGDLAKLQSTGVYRIDYIDDGTNAYCSVTGGY